MNIAAKWRGAAGWAVYLGVIIWLIPKHVVMRGDDFGYLESVAETIRAGGFRQSDWLEPFNMVMPWLGSATYGATGSFWFATYGLLIALASVNYYLLRKWLHLNSLRGELLPVAIVLSPWWLNKAVEYTGVAFSLALLLSALVTWKQQRRVLFFAVLLIGVANRQGLVCLLALPLVELWRRWVMERRIQWDLVVGGLGTVAVVAALDRWYPATFARALTARQIGAGFSPIGFLTTFGLGVSLLMGIVAGWGWIRGESAWANLRTNVARPLWPLVLMALGTMVLLVGRAELLVETPGLHVAGPLLVVILVFAGAWLGRPATWPPAEAVVYIVLYGSLVALRGRWWDYYFLEPALILAMDAGTTQATVPFKSRRWLPSGAFAMGVLYIVWFTGYLRRQEVFMTGYERALRAGEIRVEEMSEAPFGYLGWKLFDTAKARGIEGARLADFLKYVEGGRSGWRGGHLIIDREGLRRSIHPSREIWRLPAGWNDRPLPLNDEEWRHYLSPELH